MPTGVFDRTEFYRLRVAEGIREAERSLTRAERRERNRRRAEAIARSWTEERRAAKADQARRQMRDALDNETCEPTFPFRARESAFG